MSTLIIACGAIAREVRAISDQLPHFDLRCVPAELHNRPEQIAPAVESILQETAGHYQKTLIAFGDCGTQGALDRLCAEHGIDRLPGAHCYAFFAGEADFDGMMAEEPGTFFLTDFLARQFDSFVLRPLGLDRFPHLRDDYFGHYSRLVFLSQTEDPDLLARARAAADQLGLRFEHRPTGLHPFARELARLAVPKAA